MNNIIESERLIIRPTNIEDADFIFELLNSPKWKLFIGDRNIKTVLDAEEYIKSRMLPQLNRLGYSNNTIIRKSDNVKIGTCGLYDRENIDGLDIGYALLSEFEAKGYAYEASNAVMNFAFNDLNLKKLNAYTSYENFRSQKLLKKLGFSLVGGFRFPEENEDLMHFQLSK